MGAAVKTVAAQRCGLPEGLDATDMDMIRRGDMLGPVLGARVASLIQSQAARIAELEAVLRTTRTLVSEAALTGFNCHEGKWAEQLYANQATISKMVDLPRRTIQTKDATHD